MAIPKDTTESSNISPELAKKYLKNPEIFVNIVLKLACGL